MALSIEQISKNLGIQSPPIYDYEKEEVDERDTRKLTKGGLESASDDPRIGKTIPRSSERNKRRAIEAGLAPDMEANNLLEKQTQVSKMKKGKQKINPISATLLDSIKVSELSPSDNRRNTMSAYFEAATSTKPATFNIGPGLNLDSSLVRNALKKRGLNAEELKGAFDYENKEVIPPELAAIMDDVFKDVVRASRSDAITYIGPSAWKELKSNEQDALIDMSYNMGLGVLSEFTNTKDAILNLIKNRSPEAMDAVLAGMRDSGWYGRGKAKVNTRALKIMKLFSNGEDSETKRINKWFATRDQPQA